MSRNTRDTQQPTAPAERGLPRNIKLSLILGTVFALAVAAVFAVTRIKYDKPAGAADTAAAAAIAVRPNSNRLSTAPNSSVDFVEFLDFECEACGAAFPVVEKLREQYGDRVNFVIRYFPVPSHVNAERAARAVEAAAQQGELEAMYRLMYETQKEWGEQQSPMDDRFRGYAQQIGLDMARYDAAYNNPATLERVLADRQDGITLDVQATPTFFVNGKKLEPKSLDDLSGALDTALARG